MRSLRVLEAALQLTRASIDLRLRPKRRTVALLGSVQGQHQPDKPVSALKLREAQQIGGTVMRVARLLPWRPTCLRQALAVQRMLRRRNIPCQLRLGVTNPSIGAAHAWVTVADHPVVGRSGLERVTPLASFD
jgi:hypothetical protein